MTALRWVGWESWEVPAEAYDQLTDEDNLNHAKAVIICAGGGERITPRERDWLLGYHAAAGTADWVLELVATYDGNEPIGPIMDLPSMTETRRGVLHDALRMCAADGDLRPDEVGRLLAGSDEMGVDREVFAELRAIVAQEGDLRRRRYELVVAPALPGLVSPPAAPTGR
jgi:hypothetical protein